MSEQPQPQPLDYASRVQRSEKAVTSLDKYERYIVAYLRSEQAGAAYWASLVAKLFAAAVFFFGFVGDNRAMIFTGFGTLLVLDLYSAARQPRVTRTICSAVDKLASRVEELEMTE